MGGVVGTHGQEDRRRGEQEETSNPHQHQTSSWASISL